MIPILQNLDISTEQESKLFEKILDSAVLSLKYILQGGLVTAKLKVFHIC